MWASPPCFNIRCAARALNTDQMTAAPTTKIYANEDRELGRKHGLRERTIVANSAGKRQLRKACGAPGPPGAEPIRLYRSLRGEYPHPRGPTLPPPGSLPHGPNLSSFLLIIQPLDEHYMT
jgi:hypothetical protein